MRALFLLFADGDCLQKEGAGTVKIKNRKTNKKFHKKRKYFGRKSFVFTKILRKIGSKAKKCLQILINCAIISMYIYRVLLCPKHHNMLCFEHTFTHNLTKNG